MNGVNKTRPSKVCLFCKKRKKKCNREKPCQQCLRAKVECIYRDWIDSSDKRDYLSTDIKKVAYTNIQKVGQMNNCSEMRANHSLTNESGNNINNEKEGLGLNIYKEYSSISINNSRQMNYGPFSWMSIMKSDPLLCVLEEHALDKFFDLQKEEKRQDTPEKSVNKTYPVVPQNLRCFEVESNPNKLLRSDNEIDLSQRLSKEINEVLPSNKVTWHLIRVFFKNIYPFLPIIDEMKFKSNIERIVCPEEYGDETKREVIFERKSDIATVGILLILLRIAFCFEYEGNPLNCFKDVLDGKYPKCINDEEMSNSYKLISTARKCINQFNISRRSNIEVLQLTMLYKFYHRYAPETSDGVDECDADISLSSVVQLGISLGINREPSTFSNFKGDMNTCHLIRKLWYILVIWDIRQSCISGAMLIINPGQYDIKFPTYDNHVSNISEKGLEKQSIQILELEWSQFCPLKDVLELLLDVRNKSTVEEILLLLSEFECSILYSPMTINLEKDDSKISMNNKLARSIKSLTFFEIKCFLMCTYYLLFLHCEKTRSEAMYYHCQKKVLLSISSDLLVNFYGVLLTDKFFNFLIIPSIESAIQKINLILLSLILRAKYAFKDKNLSNHNSNIKFSSKNNQQLRFIKCLQGCASLCLSFSSLLSSWYCYSLQTVKAQNYLLNLIFKEEFLSQTTYDVFDKSPSQIDKLTSVCENSLRQIELMLPTSLNSNIDIFSEEYLSGEIEYQSERNDLLRQGLIKFYGGEYNSNHLDNKDELITRIPIQWFNLTEVTRTESTFNSIYDENFYLRDDLLEFYQNPNSILEMNFDDIFYCSEAFSI